MSHLVTPTTAPARSAAAPSPSVRAPNGLERRRPGRMENASPELIALMRKPDQAARLRVALYDAPGFLLPDAHRRPPASRRGATRLAVAMVACSARCTAAFQAMLTIWG